MLMDKPEKAKFEPLTDIKPVENANDQIDLKEQEPQDEPQYLEDEGTEQPESPEPKLKNDNQATTADYAQYAQPDKPGKSWTKPLIFVTVLVAAGGAGYWFFMKPKPVATNTTTSTTTASSSTAPSTAPVATSSKISTTTKSYTSPNFNLAFSYPDDWTVTDQGGGTMTVKSPSLSLKNTSSQAVNGFVVFTIKNHAQKLTEFDKGNSTATRDSLKIAYVKPTQTQRANTYVSYLQYATTTASGGLDGIYITGDSGYLKGQAIPLVDVAKVDPNITITFLDSNSKALTIADSLMDDATFSGPLINLLKSLSIN